MAMVSFKAFQVVYMVSGNMKMKEGGNLEKDKRGGIGPLIVWEPQDVWALGNQSEALFTYTPWCAPLPINLPTSPLLTPVPDP